MAIRFKWLIFPQLALSCFKYSIAVRKNKLKTVVAGKNKQMLNNM